MKITLKLLVLLIALSAGQCFRSPLTQIKKKNKGDYLPPKKHSSSIPTHCLLARRPQPSEQPTRQQSVYTPSSSHPSHSKKISLSISYVAKVLLGTALIVLVSSIFAHSALTIFSAYPPQTLSDFLTDYYHLLSNEPITLVIALSALLSSAFKPSWVPQMDKHNDSTSDTKMWEKYADMTVSQSGDGSTPRYQARPGDALRDVNPMESIADSPATRTLPERQRFVTYVAICILAGLFWILFMKNVGISMAPPEDVNQYLSVYYFLLSTQMFLAAIFANLLSN